MFAKCLSIPALLFQFHIQSSIEDLIGDRNVLPNKFEMSAREKNRAKRKAKMQAKQTTALEMDKKNGLAI